MPAATSTFIIGMFLTGCANSLLYVHRSASLILRTKWQDKQCVENCLTDHRLDFEQPVWQTLKLVKASTTLTKACS
jgi:hypothetical protein